MIEVNNTGDNSRIVIGEEALRNTKVKSDSECTKEELIEELESNRKIINRLFKKRYTAFVVMAAILFASVSVYSYIELSTQNEKETFKKYYKIYSERKSVDRGLEAFLKENYNEAAKNLADTLVIDARIFKAMALIGQKEYRMASSVLQKIETQDAEWLRALCLLRVEDHFEAKQAFEKIYTQKGLFSQQAKEILQEHYYTYSSYKKK